MLDAFGYLVLLENPRQNHRRQHRFAGRLRRLRKNPPRCKELIKSLRTLNSPWNGPLNKNLGVDHAFDAFGYLVLQQFNLAKT